MPFFKLLAGQHIQQDFTQPINKQTGKRPSKTYNQGDEFESDIDLVDKFGATKFQLVEGRPSKRKRPETMGDPTPENLRESPAKFPAGQVSTGKQHFTPPQSTAGPGTVPQSEEELDDDDEEAKEEKEVAGQQSSSQQSKRAATPQVKKPVQQPRTPTSSQKDREKNLSSMSLQELRALAEEEEIDVKGATTKEELVKVLRSEMP